MAMENDGEGTQDYDFLRKAANALVMHACRILPGEEEPDWGQISNTVLLLSQHPIGAVHLKEALERVNNPNTVILVKSFIARLAADLELKSKGDRHSTWVPVIHTASVGGLITSAIGIAAGTLTMPFGVVIVGFMGVASVSTTIYRARQFSQDAHYKRDADLVKALLTMLP